MTAKMDDYINLLEKRAFGLPTTALSRAAHGVVGGGLLGGVSGAISADKGEKGKGFLRGALAGGAVGAAGRGIGVPLTPAGVGLYNAAVTGAGSAAGAHEGKRLSHGAIGAGIGGALGAGSQVVTSKALKRIGLTPEEAFGVSKVASDFSSKIGPSYDHDVDSAREADQEHGKNLSDNRQTLGTMFSGMDAASKAETSFAKKWFDEKKPETSSMLIKTAQAVLGSSKKFASAPAAYQMVAVRAFQDELEKIAAKG